MTLLEKLTPLFLSGALLAPTIATAQPTTGQPGVDSDGDGINDDLDAEPCDLRTSMKLFDPADRTWGMMLFEDSWPAQGDFDFNDLVLAYNEVLNYDASGLFTGIRLDLRVMAVGAHYKNGLAFHVPGVTVSSVERLQLFVDGQPQAVSARSGEANLVVNLASDLHALVGAPPATWVNTDPGLPTSRYVDITLIVDLNPGSPIAASGAPFDIFLFNPDRGTEVHLPQYRGTSSLNGSLMQTADDGSTASRAFVTKSGIPFALEFPEQVMYPVEGTSIASLFPTIVEFGLQVPGAELFYRSPNLAHAFGNVSPGAFAGAGSADVSCFTADPGQCGAATGAGSVDAPTSGLCAFGSASAVTSSGGQFRWDCTGFYSSPTACTAPDLVCEPNLSSGCAIANGAGTQVCNGSGSGYGACTLAACNSGYYASGNSCLAQVCTPNSTRSCAITNGAGAETCNNLGSQWQNCTVTSCNPGFTTAGNGCVAASAADLDGDGLADAEEPTYGTNASNPDTDGDGMKDGVEVVLGTNPLVPNGRPGASGTAVSGCRHLTSGSYYLTNDVSASSGDCFTADRDVTLDCRGYAIIGGGTGAGVYLGGHRYFFTLKNCEVRGFRAGIYASAHNYYMHIDRSTFHHNVEHGVQTQHHNYFTFIDKSRASFNGLDGFHLDDFALGVDLRNNVVQNNGNYGVMITEYRDWSWSWSNPTFTINPGLTFSICGNRISGNASCEYNVYSSSGPGSPRLAPGCYEPAPSEPSCP
jgi:LruC domain-containing protein